MDDERFNPEPPKRRASWWLNLPFGIFILVLGFRSLVLGVWNHDGTNYLMGMAFTLFGGIWFLARNRLR